VVFSLHEHTPISRIETTGFLDINGTLQKFDHVINAGGPWASSLLERSGISSAFELEHVRGSHLILKADLKPRLGVSDSGRSAHRLRNTDWTRTHVVWDH
jgi:glycerol-3-phosphate dehydrogenase